MAHARYEDAWNLFFKDHEILDLAREKSIYFTILYGEGSYALVVTNRGNSRLSRKYWSSFTKALRRPCRIDEVKGEIQFPALHRKLDIQNLLYTNSYHNVVFDRYLWKSIWISTVTTYGDDAELLHEARATDFGGSKYQLVFSVAGETCQVNVVPSVVNTWPLGSQVSSKGSMRLPVEVLNHIADYLLPLERLNLMATSRSPPLTEEQIANSRLWARILRWSPWIERAAKEAGIDLLLLGPDIEAIGDKSGHKPYIFLFTFPILHQEAPWFGERGLSEAIKGSSLPFNVARGLEYDLPDMTLNLGGIFSLGRQVKFPSDQLENWLESDIFSLYCSSPEVSKVKVSVTNAPFGYGTDLTVGLRDLESAWLRCERKIP